MDYVGIDVHAQSSQVCILTEEGEILERRIRTGPCGFAAVLGDRSRARILIEASTESEWVGRCLEALGHEVVVADPNYAPMYASRQRRVKTDRRDGRALAEACRLGAYRPAHRASDRQQHVRAQLAVREALVRTRVRAIGLVRALLRREGMRVGSGSTAGFLGRLQALDLPAQLRAELAPLMAILGPVNTEITKADAEIAQVAACDAVVKRLATAPGVGVITAVAFVATLDQVDRFREAHQVEAYLGLVPRELSSGERQRRGPITKMGHGRVRWLLVEAAWTILRSKHSSTEALRAWAERIAVRRGKQVAAVALARKLAGILYAMWRDGTEYEPHRLAGSAPRRPLSG